MKLKNVFQRREVKYTMTFEQYKKLREAVEGLLTEDQYGLHTIYSLYYDTDDYAMIKKSIERPEYKEKFRVRSYGKPKIDGDVYLEIKKKVLGVVYKRRVASNYGGLSLEHIASNLERNCSDSSNSNNQIANEITYLFSNLTLKPKVLIAYDRRALFSPEDEDFRVTFDFNIRYDLDSLDFEDEDMTPLSPEVDVLMEVKSLGSYPMWFSRALSELGIFKASYSKYANVYKKIIYPLEKNRKFDEKLEEIGEKAYA
ncbi:polyphosphate polymerase domain-containing protein [Streptococcaceae bacterium ESL0687]|nr:polyphosphate polymerase domain-containing protein [Streptococcaceae bacterium ESL0687]